MEIAFQTCHMEEKMWTAHTLRLAVILSSIRGELQAVFGVRCDQLFADIVLCVMATFVESIPERPSPHVRAILSTVHRENANVKS